MPPGGDLRGRGPAEHAVPWRPRRGATGLTDASSHSPFVHSSGPGARAPHVVRNRTNRVRTRPPFECIALLPQGGGALGVTYMRISAQFLLRFGSAERSELVSQFGFTRPPARAGRRSPAVPPSGLGRRPGLAARPTATR